MININNLRVPTSEQARINGAKGGQASQRKQKRIKSFKEACRLFLDMEMPEKIANKVKEFFPELEDQEINGFMALVYAQKAKALQGDSKAFEILRDTAGEQIKYIQPTETHVHLTLVDLAKKLNGRTTEIDGTSLQESRDLLAGGLGGMSLLEASRNNAFSEGQPTDDGKVS